MGLNPPNVFNVNDLRTGDHWAVIYRVDPDGTRTLVPFADPEEGTRLAYHASDTLYFGNSVQWRRRMNRSDLVEEHQEGAPGYRIIDRVLVYDYRLNELIGPQAYEVDVHRHHGSDLSVPLEERFEDRIVFSYERIIGT